MKSDLANEDLLKNARELGTRLRERLVLDHVKKQIAHIDSTADPNYFESKIYDMISQHPILYSSWTALGWSKEEIATYLQQRFSNNAYH